MIPPRDGQALEGILGSVDGVGEDPGQTTGGQPHRRRLRHSDGGEHPVGRLVRRTGDPEDARVVRISLTPAGRRALEHLSLLHVEELSRLTAHLQPLLRGLDLEQDDRGGSRVVG